MSNVTTYIFDPTTREFLEEYSAQISPLPPHEPIVTEHHCLDAPPALGVNEAAVRNAENTAWVVTPDFRGVAVYDASGAQVAVSSIGALAAGLSLTPPPKLLSTLRAEKWDAIKRKRDKLTNEGGYFAGGKWFHSDQTSRSQQLGLVLLGANIPAGLQWKTMDGTFVTMTQTLAVQILAAAAASDTAIFAAAEVHRAAMEASQDPAAYDFSAGWPTTFLG